MAIRVCFLGGARYSQPLENKHEKKFRVLASLGELFVIGFSQDWRLRRFRQHAHFYLLPRLPLPVLRYVEMSVLGALLACWLIVFRKVRILVAQSPYEGFAAAWTKRIADWFRYRVALVVESHGDFERSLFLHRRILFASLYRFLMYRAAHFSLSHADMLRAVSHSTAQQLQKWLPRKAVVQFPTWTDMEVFLQASVKEKESYFQNILFAGLLTPRKGIHHLINAFGCIAEDFPQARLIIVGREENRYYAGELKEQVKRLGLTAVVQFLGEIPQAQLAVWMQKARVFVLPTYSEGLPRVVLEAMAAGCPVVSTRVSGIPEIVEDGITGLLVKSGDDAALAESVRWILEHSDEACELGRRARVVAERFFSSDTYVQQYARVLEEASKRAQLQ